MNLTLQTERFNGPAWNDPGGIVTPNTHAAPLFAGLAAKRADLLADADSLTLNSVWQDFVVPNDNTLYTFSVFILKDAAPTAAPGISLAFSGGTSRLGGLKLDTTTSDVDSDFTPVAFGVVEVDAEWWRAWVTIDNNGSGNTIARITVSPAAGFSYVSGDSPTPTGSIIAWGVNLTPTATLQPYEPDPFYPFAPVKPIRTHLR